MHARQPACKHARKGALLLLCGAMQRGWPERQSQPARGPARPPAGTPRQTLSGGPGPAGAAAGAARPQATMVATWLVELLLDQINLRS